MVRDRLGPALLHTYAVVKVFEGLDVDKEDFDKYAARYEITQLLHRLWAMLDCRDSLLRQCGSKKFQVYTCTYMYIFICTCICISAVARTLLATIIVLGTSEIRCVCIIL